MYLQRPLLLVLAAMLALSALPGCGSDASSNPPASPGADPDSNSTSEPDISTLIAIAGRPARADGDTFVVFYYEQEPDGVANFDLTISDENSVTLSTSERLAVAAGESVEYEGWVVHVDSVFDETLSYWFVRPDGTQVGGTPRDS